MSSSLSLRRLDLATDSPQAIADRLIREAIGGRQCHVVTLNPHIYLHGVVDEEYAECIRTTELKVIDGIGIQWGWRLLARRSGTRLTGTELMEMLSQRASSLELKIFLLGGEAGSAGMCARALIERFPRLKIVGTLEPALVKDIRDMPQDAVIEIINASGANILFVALGAPKQELFLSRNRSALRPQILMGVGGAFDQLGGGKRRAPKWISQVGFEWLFRVMWEPIRLGPRYARDIPRFIARLASEALDPS